MGGAALLSPVLNACRRALPAGDPTGLAQPVLPLPTGTQAPAAPTPTPAATPESTAAVPQATATAVPQPEPTATALLKAGLAPVALVAATDRADGVRRALALLGLNPVRGERVLLKPNYNSADPAPGSTHPDVLRALLVALTDMGARDLTLGERSGMGDTRRVLKQTGVLELADEFGMAVTVFDELEEADWVLWRSGDFHWADGFPVPRLLLDADRVVQTCNLKTHRYGGHFTLSLKNSVGLAAKRTRSGGINYMTELHNSPQQRRMIAEINTAYEPALIVMDGVEAFTHGGPAQGTTVTAGVVLAGTDRVAMDAVGVALLRLLGTTAEVSQGPIFAQEQIARAVELGLGASGPEQIQLLTDDATGEAIVEQVRAVLG
jgi:uncharacterized protein (DUF362 family)